MEETWQKVAFMSSNGPNTVEVIVGNRGVEVRMNGRFVVYRSPWVDWLLHLVLRADDLPHVLAEAIPTVMSALPPIEDEDDYGS